MTISVEETVSITVLLGPCRVVVVNVYVPTHASLPIGNGNVNEFEVPDFMVNVGVVNSTTLELVHFLPIGPDNENRTFTFCGALMQSVKLAVTATNAGLVTDEGLIVTAA